MKIFLVALVVLGLSSHFALADEKFSSEVQSFKVKESIPLVGGMEVLVEFDIKVSTDFFLLPNEYPTGEGNPKPPLLDVGVENSKFTVKGVTEGAKLFITHQGKAEKLVTEKTYSPLFGEKDKKWFLIYFLEQKDPAKILNGDYSLVTENGVHISFRESLLNIMRENIIKTRREGYQAMYKHIGESFSKNQVFRLISSLIQSQYGIGSKDSKTQCEIAFELIDQKNWLDDYFAVLTSPDQPHREWAGTSCISQNPVFINLLAQWMTSVINEQSQNGFAVYRAIAKNFQNEKEQSQWRIYVLNDLLFDVVQSLPISDTGAHAATYKEMLKSTARACANPENFLIATNHRNGCGLLVYLYDSWVGSVSPDSDKQQVVMDFLSVTLDPYFEYLDDKDIELKQLNSLLVDIEDNGGMGASTRNTIDEWEWF